MGEGHLCLTYASAWHRRGEQPTVPFSYTQGLLVHALTNGVCSTVLTRLYVRPSLLNATTSEGQDQFSLVLPLCTTLSFRLLVTSTQTAAASGPWTQHRLLQQPRPRHGSEWQADHLPIPTIHCLHVFRQCFCPQYTQHMNRSVSFSLYYSTIHLLIIIVPDCPGAGPCFLLGGWRVSGQSGLPREILTEKKKQ